MSRNDDEADSTDSTLDQLPDLKTLFRLLLDRPEASGKEIDRLVQAALKRVGYDCAGLLLFDNSGRFQRVWFMRDGAKTEAPVAVRNMALTKAGVDQFAGEEEGGSGVGGLGPGVVEA